MRAEQGLFGIPLSNLVKGCRPRGMWISLATAFLVVFIKRSEGSEGCQTTCSSISEHGTCPAGCYVADKACKECEQGYYNNRLDASTSCEECKCPNICSRCENICVTSRTSTTTPTKTSTTTTEPSEIPKVPTNTTPCQINPTEGVNNSSQACENATSPQGDKPNDEPSCTTWKAVAIPFIVITVIMAVVITFLYRRRRLWRTLNRRSRKSKCSLTHSSDSKPENKYMKSKQRYEGVEGQVIASF